MLSWPHYKREGRMKDQRRDRDTAAPEVDAAQHLGRLLEAHRAGKLKALAYLAVYKDGTTKAEAFGAFANEPKILGTVQKAIPL